MNNFNNIKVLNKAVMDLDNQKLVFSESEKDWESSFLNNKFSVKKRNEVETITIDRVLVGKNLEKKL